MKKGDPCDACSGSGGRLKGYSCPKCGGTGDASFRWRCPHGRTDCYTCDKAGVDYRDPTPAVEFLDSILGPRKEELP